MSINVGDTVAFEGVVSRVASNGVVGVRINDDRVEHVMADSLDVIKQAPISFEPGDVVTFHGGLVRQRRVDGKWPRVDQKEGKRHFYSDEGVSDAVRHYGALVMRNGEEL